MEFSEQQVRQLKAKLKPRYVKTRQGEGARRMPGPSRSAAMLANRLRQTSDSVIATTFLTAKGRVARVMLELARVCGERGRLDIALPDAIRQIDIAAMAGLTRETVNRVLVEWEHDEIVKRTSRRYFIADVGAFERELAEINC